MEAKIHKGKHDNIRNKGRKKLSNQDRRTDRPTERREDSRLKIDKPPKIIHLKRNILSNLKDCYLTVLNLTY